MMPFLVPGEARNCQLPSNSSLAGSEVPAELPQHRMNCPRPRAHGQVPTYRRRGLGQFVSGESRGRLTPGRGAIPITRNGVGSGCGAWASVELTNNASDVYSAAADLPDEGRIYIAGFSLRKLKWNCVRATGGLQIARPRGHVSAVVPDSPRGEYHLLGYRSQCGVERNGDTGCLARVGVNPVIQPTREYNK